jgi:hypothetical protein
MSKDPSTLKAHNYAGNGTHLTNSVLDPTLPMWQRLHMSALYVAHNNRQPNAPAVNDPRNLHPRHVAARAILLSLRPRYNASETVPQWADRRALIWVGNGCAQPADVVDEMLESRLLELHPEHPHLIRMSDYGAVWWTWFEAYAAQNSRTTRAATMYGNVARWGEVSGRLAMPAPSLGNMPTPDCWGMWPDVIADYAHYLKWTREHLGAKVAAAHRNARTPRKRRSGATKG